MRTEPAVSEPIAGGGEAEGDRGGGAGGGAAGGELGVVDVGRRGGHRVDAEPGEGELGQVGLAEADEAGAGGGGERPRRRARAPGRASRAEPASVAMPAVSKRSFQLIGTPSSGPRRRPAAARSAAAAASARARSGVVRA